MDGARGVSCTPANARLSLVLLAVHLCASGGQVFASYVLSEGTNSLVFAFLMIACAALLTVGSALVSDRKGLGRAVRTAQREGHVTWIVLLGINYAAKSVAFTLALWYVNALNAAVYIPLIPVFAIVMCRALGWETLNMTQMGGTVLAVSGALLVTVVRYSSSDTSTSATAILVGNGLLLLWDSTAAAAIVMQRPLLKHHSPITLSAVTVSIAAVVLGVLVPWYEGTSNSNWTLSVTAQVAIVYCGFYNLVAAWGDAWAVTQIPASVVAMWLVLEPIFTAVLSALILDDSMTVWELVGSFLTCGGLLVVLSQVQPVPGGVGSGKLGTPGRQTTEDAPLLA